MKFKKIYHALTADPENKWKESFHETVEIDQAQAEDENSRFDLTGVKYVLDDTTPEETPEAETPETETPEAETQEAETHIMSKTNQK